jgi:hypothetical protein
LQIILGFKKRKRPTFSVAIESAKKVFEAQTGLELAESQKYKDYWCFVSQKEIKTVEEWERKQSSLIYLRDCLSLSVVIDSNLIRGTSGEYTVMGALGTMAKRIKIKMPLTMRI